MAAEFRFEFMLLKKEIDALFYTSFTLRLSLLKLVF